VVLWGLELVMFWVCKGLAAVAQEDVDDSNDATTTMNSHVSFAVSFVVVACGV
jgi:hypothetical protein